MSGELDIATASTVDATLRSALAASPATLVVNLSGVTFCDSMGMSPLEEVERRGRRLGIAVMFVGVPDCVVRLRWLASSLRYPSPLPG